MCAKTEGAREKNEIEIRGCSMDNFIPQPCESLHRFDWTTKVYASCHLYYALHSPHVYVSLSPRYEHGRPVRFEIDSLP